MKEAIKRISAVLLITLMILLCASCSAGDTSADGDKIYPVGSGSLKYDRVIYDSGLVNVVFYVEDNNFTREEYQAFMSSIWVDECSLMGNSDKLDGEWFTKGEVVVVSFSAPDGFVYSEDKVHLPKLVEVD